MCSVRVTRTTQSRKAVERQLKTAQQQGRLRQVTYGLARLAVGDGRSFAEVAVVLRVHEQTVAVWIRRFCCEGLHGVPRQKPPGRPPKRTPLPKEALTTRMDEGPIQAGFSRACWRSPMLQQLIYERCGVFYNVFYIAQLRKHLGYSYQKAAVVADPLNDAKRQEWCTTIWPQIVSRAKAQHALLLCGAAASFPQWGTLSYTWARRGHQPLVRTSGQRQGYKVFGVIEYFSGRFWYHGQEGRLNSAAYITCLTGVWEQTTQPILLMQDGARYHTSTALQRFFALHTERLTVFQLPSDSPEYHPIEQLWKNVKTEGTHLQYFPTDRSAYGHSRARAAEVCQYAGRDAVAVPSTDRNDQGGLSAPGQKIFFLKAIASPDTDALEKFLSRVSAWHHNRNGLKYLQIFVAFAELADIQHFTFFIDQVEDFTSESQPAKIRKNVKIIRDALLESEPFASRASFIFQLHPDAYRKLQDAWTHEDLHDLNLDSPLNKPYVVVLKGLDTFKAAHLLAERCLNHTYYALSGRKPGIYPFTNSSLKKVWEATKPRPRWFIRLLHDLLQLAKDERIADLDDKFVDPAKLDALSVKVRRDEEEDVDDTDDERLA